MTAPGLSVAYRGSDAVVYHNAHALPRVFLVGTQQPVSTEGAALSAVTAPGFDGRRAAITESQVPGIPTRTGSSPGSSSGTARLVRYGAQDVTAVANAQRPALLVLTDSYYPGWNVTVDGRPAHLLRVDYLLRGVAPPGRPSHDCVSLRPHELADRLDHQRAGRGGFAAHSRDRAASPAAPAMTADGYTPRRSFEDAGRDPARGLRPVLGDYARFAGDAAAGLPRVVLGSNRRFSIWGRSTATSSILTN